MNEISLDTKFKDLEAWFPFARQVLFEEHHLGGCGKCGFSSDDSLLEIAKTHNKDPQAILQSLVEGVRAIQDSYISPQELKAWTDSGEKCLLIDVRQAWEFEICKIPGSILLTEENIGHVLQLAQNTKYVGVVCHHGLRALHATLYFQKQGVPQARCLKGGTDAYSVEIDSTLQRY